LGVSIASASWVFLLFPIIIVVGAVYFIKIEEVQCVGHYGNAYREYMNRTPKMDRNTEIREEELVSSMLQDVRRTK